MGAAHGGARRASTFVGRPPALAMPASSGPASTHPLPSRGAEARPASVTARRRACRGETTRKSAAAPPGGKDATASPRHALTATPPGSTPGSSPRTDATRTRRTPSGGGPSGPRPPVVPDREKATRLGNTANADSTSSTTRRTGAATVAVRSAAAAKPEKVIPSAGGLANPTATPPARGRRGRRGERDTSAVPASVSRETPKVAAAESLAASRRKVAWARADAPEPEADPSAAALPPLGADVTPRVMVQSFA